LRADVFNYVEKSEKNLVDNRVFLKVILYSYFILKKMNERITDS